MIGNKIQNYRIEEMLGEGGMGTVYRATDTLLKRSVAIKVFHQHLLRDASFIERFSNEAVLSAQLNHPNVATLYNLLEDRGNSLMVMEYIDGKTLEQLLRLQGGKLPITMTLRVVMQVLDGLQHAHDKTILHRDIKPANIMLNRLGAVKLMDFGIARMIGSQRMTRANRIIGTLEYMAPELLENQEPSIQSDLYAVGILLFELLTGKMPFNANSETTLISQILNKKPDVIQTYVPDIPKSLEDIVEKLLQKKPEKRYASATELKQALAGIISPGLIEMNQLDTLPPPPQVKTTIANSNVQKPQTNPTHLAKVPSEHRKTLTTYLHIAKNQVFTVEGIILSGAAIIALIIIFLGFGTEENIPETKQNREVVVRDNVMPKAAVIQQTKEDTIKKVAEPEGHTIRLEEKNEGYYKKYTPIKIVESDRVKKSTRPLPVAKKEAIVEKEPQRKETTTEQIKAKNVGPITFANINFSAELNQSISSENPEMDGREVWLSVSNPIVVDGVKVIDRGAKVKAKITNVRPIATSKMAILQLYFREVQAVDGQWIDIKADRYTEKSYSAITFEQGKRIDNLRTGKAKVNF